jgi:four helix bundle protein
VDYWLSLLKDEEYIKSENYESISQDCIEIIKLLTSTIKTLKNSLK